MSDTSSTPVSKLERFVKACETAANAIVPTILTTQLGLPINYALAIMPIFVIVMEIIRQFITQKRTISGITIAEAGRGGWHNQYYTYVSWYIANNVTNVNQTFIKFGYDDSKDGQDRYIRTSTGNYYVDFEGAKIKAVCIIKTENGANANTIQLNYHDQAILTKFIFHCQSRWTARFKHDIHMYTYSNRQWSGYPLLNTKTPDYLFINTQLHRKIFDDAVKFAASEAYYKHNCLAWKRGYLFYGTPGCGKSSAMMALATLLKRSIYRINHRECESNAVFESMCRTIPKESIVSLEDIDSLGSVETRYKYTITREDAVKFAKCRRLLNHHTTELSDDCLDLIDILSNDTKKEPRTNYWDDTYIDHLGCRLGDCTDKQQAICRFMDDSYEEFKKYAKKTVTASKNDTITLDTILNVLDGYTYFYGCIIIITTNAVERLDPAVIRQGRVEVKCEFTPATPDIIYKMYSKYCGCEFKYIIPATFQIAQSKIVHDVFVCNDMDPIACSDALKALIERIAGTTLVPIVAAPEPIMAEPEHIVAEPIAT
ncbi:putative AAA family ATPase [Faustovirus]|nr:putative AAA family ATPase [Faustovirus]